MNIYMFKSDFFQLSDYIDVSEKNILNISQFNSKNIIKLFPVVEFQKEIINNYLDINNNKRILYLHDKINIKRKEESIIRLENPKNNNNLYLNKNITNNNLKKEEKRELKTEKNEFQYIQKSNTDNNNKEDNLSDNCQNDDLNKSIKDNDNLKIIFNIKNEYLNKKRKNVFEFNNNNIYIPDNDLKKIRLMILDCLIEYINKKIKQFEKDEIKFGICKWQFLPINKENLYHSKIEFDKKFLNKTIKELLSWDISKKYTNFLKDKNSQLVQDLISSENGKYFRDLFELTFLDCLNYINGTKDSILLDGFPKIEEIVLSKGIKNKQDIERYKNYINNYELGLNSKISKHSKKTIKR